MMIVKYSFYRVIGREGDRSIAPHPRRWAIIRVLPLEIIINKLQMSRKVPELEGRKHYKVDFKSIEGYASLLTRKTEGHSYSFILSSTLYVPPVFSGHTHHSIPISMIECLHQGQVIAPIDQICFFHSTSNTSSSLLLIIELVAMPMSSSSTPLSLGWGMLQISEQRSDKVLSKCRVPLYEGTPRLLLATDSWQPKDVSSLVSIPGCIVTLSLSSHPILLKASHLIPDNTLVAFDDIIPGLIHTNIPEAFPKVLKTQMVSLKKISLFLLPSVDVFEADLLVLLREEIESGSVTIEERRLKFLPYNGWTYTSSPAVVNLNKPVQEMRSSSRPVLMFRGSLELPPLPPHPLMEVVVQLEYILKLDRDKIKQGFPSSSDIITLILCWGVWLPYDREAAPLTEEGRFGVELKRGPGYQPSVVPNSAHKICYEGGLMDVGKLAFLASPANSQQSGDDVQLFTPSGRLGDESGTPGIEGIDSNVFHSQRTDSNLFQPGIETADSGVAIDKDNELNVGQPLDMSTPMRNTATPTPLTDPPLPTKMLTINHPVISIGTKLWVEPISRTLLSYFYSSGIPEPTTPMGTPLTYVDLSKTGHNGITREDRAHSILSLQDMLSCRIMIQLMGIEFKSTPPLEVPVPDLRPSTISINYQFLYDPPTSTQLYLITPSDQSSPTLLSVNKDGSPGITYLHHTTSSPSHSDHDSISRYFQSSSLTFSIVNCDSGFLIGTAVFPLQILLSSSVSKDYHVPVCIPLVYNDTSGTTVNIEPLAEGGPSRTVGRLYLSLGTLSSGKPPTAQLTSSVKPHLPPKSTLSYPLFEDIPNDDVKIVNEKRIKKLARMESVRTQRNLSIVFSEDPTVEQQQKHDAISSALLLSLSSSLSFTSRLGESIYFEHEFASRSDKSTSVVIEWNNPDLKLIASADEVHYLRKHFRCHGAIDDPSVISTNERGRYGIYLSANEKIKLPFKYLKQWKEKSASSGQLKQNIKVNFSDADTGVLLSVLSLEVTLMDQRVDRLLHVYHNEGMFMRKELPIPQSVTLKDSEDLTVACSDINTSCVLRESQNNIGQAIVCIKTPTGKSPSTNTLYIMLYNDVYLVSPVEVWKLCIHSVQRLEHSILIGQSSVLSLSIKGDHVNRKITYHTHSTNPLKVVAPSSHLMAPHSLSEVLLTLKTLVVGHSQLLLSARDVLTGAILMMWSIDVSASRPLVSRAFNVALPLGDEPLKKTIKWLNPYMKRKKFYLSSTCPDLVSFDEDTVKLNPSETTQLSLVFTPLLEPTTAEVIVFINSKSDLTEECFLIRLVYQ